MTRHPRFGLFLAAFGTLVLTPDALLMRLSGMGGFQMNAWRGLLMGTVMLIFWLLTSRAHRRDLQALKSGVGLTIVICQFFNSLLFCLGIALAPAAVVLFGVAAVPVFAALFAWVLIGEPTRPLTWVAIAAVMAGISVAVSGGREGALSLDLASVWGALLGLGVAVVLALNFVVLRARPHLPIPLTIGLGALISGCFGLWITGPAAMPVGEIRYMMITALFVLPVSFFSLSLASRYTHAANVSLLMLLETVLGPFWLWLGVGETPTPQMLIGGATVVISLTFYLLITGRQTDEPAWRS